MVGLLAAALLVCAGFMALGTWQVHRLAWKKDLIARSERNAHAEAVAAPGPAAWLALDRHADEYRRVRVQGRYAHERETLVHASTELGSGYWVLTPLRTSDGFWLLVNRGFVPTELRERSTRSTQEPAGEQMVTGLLRLSEPGGSLLQHNAPDQGRWYSRDVQAIAAARGLPGPVAPYFIDAVADEDAARSAWPRSGLTVLRFSNNHLVYAATWFALAALAAGAVVALVIDERRKRRR